MAITRPVFGSIFWMRPSASWNRCLPSKAVPACAATSIERTGVPLAVEGVQPVSGREPDEPTVKRNSMNFVDAGKGSIFTQDFRHDRVMLPHYSPGSGAGSNKIVVYPGTDRLIQRRARP